MGKLDLVIAGGAALLLGAAGASAIAASEGAGKQARPGAAGPLLPLSDRDQTSTREAGTCSFWAENGTLLQAVGNELTVRTRAGRQVCRITDDQLQSIVEATGTYACGGVRMSLRGMERGRPMPASDGFVRSAALTVTQGRTRRTITGIQSCTY